MKKRLIAGSAIAALTLSLATATGAVADEKFRDGKRISDILSGLVSKGTLTEAQVDAISQAMQMQEALAKLLLKQQKLSESKLLLMLLVLMQQLLKPNVRQVNHLPISQAIRKMR